MSYNRIIWTNTEDTPLNAQNLNTMDNGIYSLDRIINAFDKLLTYPNLSADCITGNYQITDGSTLEIEDSCLIITGGSNTVDISSDLIETKLLDTNRIMLIKLRIKKNSGTNLSVYFKYITATDEVYVTTENIIASNLNTAVIGNPSYTITDDSYHDVWCIFDSQSTVSITGIAIEIAASTPNATISNFHAFYSMDKAGSGGGYFVQTTYQQQLLGSSLSSPTSTTYETSGGGTIVG